MTYKEMERYVEEILKKAKSDFVYGREVGRVIIYSNCYAFKYGKPLLTDSDEHELANKLLPTPEAHNEAYGYGILAHWICLWCNFARNWTNLVLRDLELLTFVMYLADKESAQKGAVKVTGSGAMVRVFPARIFSTIDATYQDLINQAYKRIVKYRAEVEKVVAVIELASKEFKVPEIRTIPKNTFGGREGLDKHIATFNKGQEVVREKILARNAQDTLEMFNKILKPIHWDFTIPEEHLKKARECMATREEFRQYRPPSSPSIQALQEWDPVEMKGGING